MDELLKTFGAMYPASIIAVLILMAIYYKRTYNQVNKSLLPLLIFLSLLVYFISFFGNYELQFFMLAWFLRDFLIFIFSIAIWKLFLRFPRSVFIGIIILIIGAGFLYFKNGSISFSKLPAKEFTSNKEAELIFELKDKKYLGKVDTLLLKYKPQIIQAFPHVCDTASTTLDNCYTIDVTDTGFVSNITELLNKSGLTEWVEMNETYSLSPIEKTQNDSIKTKTYQTKTTNDTHLSKIWGFNFMDLDNLLSFLKKVKPVKKARIFILDTGVDGKHEDLASNYISLSEKYDKDTQQHGTHCAGIASAVSNNFKGIASLNLTGQLTSVTSITVLPGGSGTQESIIDGIILASDNGADVISMSLGGLSTDSRQKAYEKAIQYAKDKGAIIVVAAGNENTNAKATVPASCKGVICVSAVNDSLQKASFSNYVTDIDFKIAAPGVNIYSTIPMDQYKAMNGTSMAAPYVSALVGIMKSIEPELNTEDIYRMLVTTGIETKNTNLTGKFIQPLKAVSEIKSLSFRTKVTIFINKLQKF